MPEVHIFFGAIAAAVVCAVWAIGGNVGDGLTKRKPLMRSAGCTDAQHSNGGVR